MGDQTTLWVHERKEPNCRCSTSDMMLGWCDHVASNTQRKATRDELLAAVVPLLDLEAAAKAVSRKLRYEYPQLRFPPGVNPSYQAIANAIVYAALGLGEPTSQGDGDVSH